MNTARLAEDPNYRFFLTEDMKYRFLLREDTNYQSFVNNNIFLNQTNLVEALLKNGFYEFKDIKNSDDTTEIFSWYAVTDGLADDLVDAGQPVLINEFGSWWGRTCFGKSLYMDRVLQDIYQNA